MDLLTNIIRNKLVLLVAISWFAAQLVKTALYCVVNKQFRAERLFGAGGMPSAHSASVTSLVVGTAILYGVSGYEFAFSVVFAAVVIYEARGVRREAGDHAKLLNRIIDVFESDDFFSMGVKERLNEFIGHTGMQILMGCILSIGICFSAYAFGFFS